MTRTFLIAVAASAFLLVAAGLAPAQPQSDPVIDAARKAAAAFSQSLPDYAVKRTTKRYRTGPSSIGSGTCSMQFLGGQMRCLRILDVVTADVVTENGSETYLNLKVDGKPVQKPSQRGSWTQGEFASVLKAIFAPESDAQFLNQRSTIIAGRTALCYDYSIDQSHSTWHLGIDAAKYSPAYTGAIWIDSETSRVLRIEMSAQNMPANFAMQSVESSLEYGSVKIGEENYLLPAHSETLFCQRAPAVCGKNTTDFQNYKKYSADSVITFNDQAR